MTRDPEPQAEPGADAPAAPVPQRATFILRLWRERDEGATWRAEVECVQSGERIIWAASAAKALERLRQWLED